MPTLSLSLSLAIAVRTKIVTKRTLSEQLDNIEPQQRSVFICFVLFLGFPFSASKQIPTR